MKKSVLLQLFLYVAYAAIAQEDPADYDYYSASDKKIVFSDRFADDRNNWLSETTGATASIENGYLRMETGEDNCITVLEKPMIDKSKDFELEIQIRHIKTESKYTVSGVTWGADKEGKGYVFGHNYLKSFLAFKHGNDRYFSGKAETAIDLNKFNRLTIRKTGNTYYFFINKKFVNKTAVQSFFGQHFGLWLASRSLLYIDNYTLAYLDKPSRAVAVTEKKEEELSFTEQQQRESLRKRQEEKTAPARKNTGKIIYERSQWPLKKQTDYSIYEYHASKKINVYVNKSDQVFNFGKIKPVTIAGFEMTGNWRISFGIAVKPSSSGLWFTMLNDTGKQVLSAKFYKDKIKLGWLTKKFHDFIISEELKPENWMTDKINSIVIEHRAGIIMFYLNGRLVNAWMEEGDRSSFGDSDRHTIQFYPEGKGTFNLLGFKIERPD